ncbi:MAG: DUF4175 domain-containing protein [Hyphomonadaceae bacterium]|nr:DUF4175 domain-containing protein [Hyphomonadaceae bacterium]
MADLNRIPGTKRLIDLTFGRLRRIELWRAWWPFLALLVVFAGAAILGAFERAPAGLSALGALIFLVGLIIAFLRGLRRYQTPRRDQAIEALDQQSDLRPLSSLADRPARPDVEGVKLWRAHEERLTDAIRRLRVPGFAAVWNRIDPARLRFVLPAFLALVLALNWNTAQSRLMSALDPDYGSLFGAENVRIEAWIAPPEHTGRAPIFLKAEQTEVRVPAGSVMTLRAQAPSAPKLRVSNADGRETVKFEATPDGAFEITTMIEADSSVAVRWWGERKAWTVLASPDSVPQVEFVELPVLGDGDRTEFSWKASDDYGVAKLELAIRPTGEDRAPDLVPVELGGISPREAEEESKLDLTRNRWAGARVDVWLIATDGAGQTGVTEPYTFKLPEKLLLQPLAKAIQDVRVTVLREDEAYGETDPALDSTRAGAYYVSATQRLEAAPAGVQRGAIMLEAVTYKAPRYFRDVLVYSGLETARYALEASVSTEEAKSTEPLLWSLALRAEYGSAADAYAALMAAKKALEDALRDGASEEEIRRLMEAFKDAAQRYIAAKMAEALANGLEPAPDNRDSSEGPGGSGLGGQGFSDMLDALEDLTETGATDQARQLLADITNMLENLEFQQGSGSGEGFPGMPGQDGEGEDSEDLPEEEREMTETMRELSDLLREQRELNDETLAQQRGERGQDGEQSFGENQPGLGDPSQPGQGLGDIPDWMEGEDGRSLAERQRELADRLEELAESQLGTGEEGEGEGAGGLLDEDTVEAIERSQRRAGNALDDGNENRAIRNQEQATRQLRELAEGLAEALDEAQADRVGEPQGSRDGAADPFGRSPMGGIDDSNSVDIPDEAERQRAKDILDELRRRYDEAVDEDEREYLERLLDRF